MYPIYIISDDDKLIFRQYARNDYIKLLLEHVYEHWLKAWQNLWWLESLKLDGIWFTTKIINNT